ncbi:uncharacterized protein YALI1_A15373g [Yarrowia lipolytica]|uniref:Uncharacterized protein n=1 Tax=Yarrowia lipolytica TaxID=4952 RepID=A0A1D8N4X9_YARLL|nr:hypothetical protein YALI1_A15373g [Yarrowia lipolytica]
MYSAHSYIQYILQGAPYSHSHSNTTTRLNLSLDPSPLQLPHIYSVWRYCTSRRQCLTRLLHETDTVADDTMTDDTMTDDTVTNASVCPFVQNNQSW